MLRLPDGMRDALKGQAKASNRSLNAEIVARLEASLDPHERIQSQSDSQLKVLYMGVELVALAAKLLAREMPAVEEVDAFRILQNTIEASLGSRGIESDRGLAKVHKDLHQTANTMRMRDKLEPFDIEKLPSEYFDLLNRALGPLPIRKK